MKWINCLRRNIKAAVKWQLNQKDWFQQVFTKRNAWGIFSSYSHWKKDGNAKQTYVLEAHAQRAAESMEKRYGHKYKVYRCMFCDGFHIGKPLKP